jgi:hypothetical protein
LNEVLGQWEFGLNYNFKMCAEFDLKECHFTFHEHSFDAQAFRYYVQIMYHTYEDPALKDGQMGIHLDVYPRIYASERESFNPEDFEGIYFNNPLPDECTF